MLNRSKLLKQVVAIGNDKDGRFPDLSEQLQYFEVSMLAWFRGRIVWVKDRAKHMGPPF